MSTSKSTPAGVASDAIPKGYLRDAKGRLVPEGMVKPIDQLRDQTVSKIMTAAFDLRSALTAFKQAAFSDIASFVETSADQFEVKIGGDKGNVTLYSFDGRFKVVRAVHDFVRFDERLKAAKALIDECIHDWSEGSREEIKVLINDAFAVDREGDVRASRVLGLRRLNITDARWLRAMQAISESVSVVGSASYIRLYQRVGDTDRYDPVSLDIANV